MKCGFANSVRKVCGSRLSEASRLIGLIYIGRQSIGYDKDDDQEKEEVAGRVLEEGLESV